MACRFLLAMRILALLLVVALAAPVLAPSPALAADEVFDAGGLIEVLPVSGVVADGKTEVLVHAVLRTPTGSGVLGAKLRATTTAGSVGDVIEVGDGVYRFRFTPPDMASPTKVTLGLRGRTTELGPIEASREVEVLGKASGRVSVETSQFSLVLGQDTETTVTVSFPAGMSGPPSLADVGVRTSSGVVTGLVPIGDGRFAGRYEVPSVNFPHLATITVVDRRNPGEVWGHATIRLLGKVDYPVTTAKPGATVMLEVGDRRFGPVVSDESKRASVPIIVPPGVRTANQITTDGATASETSIDLRVPDARRLTLFELPSSVPADARLGVPVRVVVRTPAGEPDNDANVVLTATAGRISNAMLVGDGVYSARYTPPDGRVAMEATVEASLDAGGSQGDAVAIALIPAMPARMTLTAEPESLSSAGTGLRIYASLATSDGAGLPERALRVRAAGASLKGPVTDLKGGDYRIDLTADQGTDVLVRVLPASPPSRNALSQVVLLPSRVATAPGGSQTVTVVTTDTFGYPVPNALVELFVSKGGGQVPSTVATDGNGFAEVVYQAGSAPGLAVIEARAGQARGSVAFYQSAYGDAATLPASGTVATRSVITAWETAQGALYVEREGGADAPVGVADAVPGGEAASVSLAADPAVASPGGEILLQARVADDQGNGVEGATLEFFATGGARVRDVQSLGGGQYSARLEVPVDASETVKVNAVVNGGKALSVLEVPMSPDAVRVEAPPVASATDVVAEPKPAAPEVDRPFLRFRVSFLASSYQYEQNPGTGSPLLGSSLGWGGDRGGAPVPLGLDTQLRVFIPNVPYVGFDGQFRYSRYVVESPTFSSNAVDNLFFGRADLVVRYPFAVNQDQMHFGVRAGFRYDDLITFRGCTDPGCTVTYEPLSVPGLGVGAELGAEFWKMYLVASGEAGFAYATQPFAANADLNLGIHFIENAFFDIGFGWQMRSATLLGADSGATRGEVSDMQFMGTAGVGFAL